MFVFNVNECIRINILQKIKSSIQRRIGFPCNNKNAPETEISFLLGMQPKPLNRWSMKSHKSLVFNSDQTRLPVRMDLWEVRSLNVWCPWLNNNWFINKVSPRLLYEIHFWRWPLLSGSSHRSRSRERYKYQQRPPRVLPILRLAKTVLRGRATPPYLSEGLQPLALSPGAFFFCRKSVLRQIVRFQATLL